MQSTILINTSARVARKATTGTELPPAACKLLAQWQVTFGFFAEGSAVAAISGLSLRFALKETATGPALVFSSTFTQSSGLYTADIASVDSSALRTLLGDQASVVVVGEVEWTVSGRIERVHFPVIVTNAWLRPDTTAPDPVAEASVTWLNEQFAARITPGGYMEFQNTAGDWFHLPLNSGRAPS